MVKKKPYPRGKVLEKISYTFLQKKSQEKSKITKKIKKFKKSRT